MCISNFDFKNEGVLFTPFSLKKVMTHLSDFDEIEINN